MSSVFCSARGLRGHDREIDSKHRQISRDEQLKRRQQKLHTRKSAHEARGTKKPNSMTSGQDTRHL